MEALSTISLVLVDVLRAATSAKISSPKDIARDGAGNIYICDTGTNANVIRRLDTRTGLISTFAGNGTSVFSGVSSSATSGTSTFGIA